VVLLFAQGFEATLDCSYPPPYSEVEEGPRDPQPLLIRSRELVSSWTECYDCPSCTGFLTLAPVLHCNCQADPICRIFGYQDEGVETFCDANPWISLFMTTLNGNRYSLIGKTEKVQTSKGEKKFFRYLFLSLNDVATHVLEAPSVGDDLKCNTELISNAEAFENGLLNVHFYCSVDKPDPVFNMRLEFDISYTPQINSHPSGYCLDGVKGCSNSPPDAWHYLVSNPDPVMDLDLRTPVLDLNGVQKKAGFGEMYFSSSGAGSYILSETVPVQFPGRTVHLWKWYIQYTSNTCFCDPEKYPEPDYPPNYQCCLFSDPTDIDLCQKTKHASFY